MMVVEAEAGADCPACGSHVGPDATLPPEPQPEPEPEPTPEDEVPSAAPPPAEWNLGEPMHRVFWLCLVAPQQVVMATVFRSLRWVFLFGWLGQMVVQASGLAVAPKLLEARADEAQIIDDLAEATRRSEAGGPEARRIALATKKLCSLSMVTPELRLHCALADSFDALRPAGQLAKRQQESIEQMRRAGEESSWLRILPDSFAGLLFTILPLWGLLALARHPQAWSVALKTVVFAQPPLIAGAVVSVVAMLMGGPIGMSVGMFALVGGVIWAIYLLMAFLVRMGGLAAPQAALMVMAFMMFNLVLLSSIGMLI